MICYVLYFLTFLFSHNAKSENFQVSINNVSETSYTTPSFQQHFLQPIKFTHHGLRCFIRHAYNHPHYGSDFLPSNFRHMTEFFLKQTNLQTRNYYQAVFRMFGNKLKESLYVSPYALSELVNEIAPLLQRIFDVPAIAAPDVLQNKIAHTMYDAMLQKFDYLKLDPQGYFGDLSQKILIDIEVAQELADDISPEELRKSMLLFFELALNKCVWSPNDPQEAWRSVRKLADQVLDFQTKGIIKDQDDLNGLIISLIERFCLYLDLSYAEISVEFYTQLHKEIESKTIPFLLLENEEYFETKSQRLSRAVVMAEAKTRAYQAGILVG